MSGPIHKKVLDNHVEHPNVAVGQVLLAFLQQLLAKRGTVLLTDSLLGIDLIVKSLVKIVYN